VIFRSHRIATGDPWLAGRDLDPARYRAVNDRVAAGTVLGEQEDSRPLLELE
jgi:hypothetical protein